MRLLTVRNSITIVLLVVISWTAYIHIRIFDTGNTTNFQELYNTIRAMQDLAVTNTMGKKNDTGEAPLSKVRILCWIMTSPDTLDSKAQHVKKTWGKRCDVLLFVSSVTNDKFPTIGFNVSEGRGHLTAKTMLAFRYVYEHYLDEADWFMKADDDTYVIVENLRYFLSDKNTNDPVFFGHHFATVLKQGYFSGGAGYVVSKEALRRFGKVKTGTKFCRKDGGAEDVAFGRCLEYLGVKAGSSIDAEGKSRFHCFQPLNHLKGNYPKWYYTYDEFAGKKMPSDYSISFHYVSANNMYLLDFLIYHLKPFGYQSQYRNESYTNATA